jgi:predicted small lipoprotein YifL
MKKLAVFMMLCSFGLFVTGCGDSGPDEEKQTPVNETEQKEMHDDTPNEEEGGAGGGTASNGNGGSGLDDAPPDPTGASTGK